MEKSIQYTATLKNAVGGMVRWAVDINGQSFDFGEGIGHFVTGGRMWKYPEEVTQSIAEYIASKGQLNPRNISATLAGYYSPTKRLPKAKWSGKNGVVFGLGPIEPPELDSVLYCLVSDADAENMGFSDWCGNFGYDTDSRTALATYLECQQIAEKLRKAGINIAAERERLADY